MARPRDAALDDAVREATMVLLAERGYARLRIDDIAAAAGTAKSTVYRRWPTLTHLVVDAMERALDRRSFSPTGDLATDLDALVDVGLGAVTGGPPAVLAAALDIHRQGDPALRADYRTRIIDPVRDHAIAVIENAAARGDIGSGASAADLVDAVIGGLIYRVTVLGEPVSIDDAKRFWRVLVAGRGSAPPEVSPGGSAASEGGGILAP